MKPPRYWIAIAATAFLAPLLGGQLVLDPQALAPGGLLSAIFREPQGASLAHWLVVLPALAALIYALARRHVQQLPQPRIAGTLGIFLLFMWGSVLTSEYRFISAGTALEWTAVLLLFFSTVALAGRHRGPVVLLAAFVAGTALVGALGIREFAMQRDPNWRVFANWSNPNALAGLLPFGVLGGLGLIAAATDRIAKLLSGLAVLLCFIAMILTGSKGGLLALAVGLVILLVWWAIQGGTRRVQVLAVAVLLPALGFGLAVGLSSAQRAKTPASGSALGRIAQAGNTQEQSAGFRSLLWKSAGALIKDQPFGRGMGTFRYHSSRPGLVTQTHLAHQSFLQIGVEAGIIALGALVAALAMMAIEGLRGVRKLPTESRLLRGAVFAALGAAVVHNLIDSDLYLLGTNVGMFLFAGILLQLTPDGSSPEFAGRSYRAFAAFAATLTVLGMAYVATTDVRLGGLRHLAGERSPEAESTFKALSGWAPSDHRLWALGARMAADPAERTRRLETSVSRGPTLAVLRLLATEREAAGDSAGALHALNQALASDPNNLEAMSRLVALHAKDNPDKAEEIAGKLVQIESTPYFKIRALPELVPTETYEARAWLAARTGSAEAQAELLRGALEGYLSYAANTVPQVKMFANSGIDGGFGGIRLDDAHTTLTTAIDLIGLYEAAAPQERVWADETRTTLIAARDSLSETTP